MLLLMCCLLVPNYNGAPNTFQPVVRLDDEGERELTTMRWRLIPFFSKDPKPTHGFRTLDRHLLANSGLAGGQIFCSTQEAVPSAWDRFLPLVQPL
jgi:hypothetical protein